MKYIKLLLEKLHTSLRLKFSEHSRPHQIEGCNFLKNSNKLTQSNLEDISLQDLSDMLLYKTKELLRLVESKAAFTAAQFSMDIFNDH